jgi:6-phosphogluconolactonase
LRPLRINRPAYPKVVRRTYRDGDAVKTLAAGLTIFRIGDDGKLTFVRKYDIDVGDKTIFWMGIVPL